MAVLVLCYYNLLTNFNLLINLNSVLLASYMDFTYFFTSADTSNNPVAVSYKSLLRVMRVLLISA